MDKDGGLAGKPVGRRVVIGVSALGALGVAFGARIESALNGVLGAISAHDPTGITSLLPGGGGFQFYNVASFLPYRSDQDYRLTIDGLVDHPTTYTLAELAALPQTTLVRDVQCVTGWRVPNTEFGGVLLSELLDRAGVKPEGKALRFTCFDDVYSESLTLAEARRPDVMVAHQMDKVPVTRDHGGPVRLYVAPMYFYKSAKWLSGITVTDRVMPGYWEQNGYDVEAWVGRSNGRTDAPIDGE
ncbi:molybdopterin-dependent oxidoreductase [Streptacidiphilus sp. P02-A3a]|uniref:molybdopterin-dependent oxidoreductase n=1 Tax=Streptacidiphilus sp. P02-A3a TaxID=2704468 RepID=UPI0015FB9536|nr:molybdopterin-dependent oxidoreductase [Streptacidiphilus sp. P02-A3a]QMU69246.1 molybdopterin-dependent oxidoreductase [Streptacidiphilus sp. P02-A3a]